MKFQNIYKNRVTLIKTGNVGIQFDDHGEKVTYLVDIQIDKNISISDISSVEGVTSVGYIVNTSDNVIGIRLTKTSVEIYSTKSHIIELKIKHGIMLRDAALPPDSSYTIPKGYSFGIGSNGIKLLSTVRDKNAYVNNFNTFSNSFLLDVNKLLHFDEQLTNTSDLLTEYSHDNDTYPKFAYTDKLIASSTENDKNKYINTMINEESIHSGLFVNMAVERDNLAENVESVLVLMETAVQRFYLNGETISKSIDKEVNINVSDNISFAKIDVNEMNLGYGIQDDIPGETSISEQSIDIQTKIINYDKVNETTYNNHFVTYQDGPTKGKYGFSSMDNYFRKTGLIKFNQNTVASDNTLYSSKKAFDLMSKKVDLISSDRIDNDFKKITTSKDGLVKSSNDVETTDLTGLIKNHYQRSGVAKVINNPSLTIFFI